MLSTGQMLAAHRQIRPTKRHLGQKRLLVACFGAALAIYSGMISALAHGGAGVGHNSRLLDGPSYYMRLYDRLNVVFRQKRYQETKNELPQIRFNGDQRSALGRYERLADVRLLPLPDADLEQLERELGQLVERYLRPFFGEELGQIIVLIHDSDELGANVSVSPKFAINSDEYSFFNINEHIRIARMNEAATSAIILTRGLLLRLSSLDSLIGVIGHELFHVLRGRLVLEPDLDTAFKSMAEENRADAAATIALGKAGLNPIGMSNLLEVLAQESDRRRKHNAQRSENKGDTSDEPQREESVAGLLSHPPDEMRISHVNALIEKLADRQSFPAMTPLPKSILDAVHQKTVLDWEKRTTLSIDRALTLFYPFFLSLDLLSAYIRPFSHWLNEKVSLADQKKLSRKPIKPWLKKYLDEVIPIYAKEMDRYLAQVTSEKLLLFAKESGLTPKGLMQLISTQFDKIYKDTFTSSLPSLDLAHFELKEGRLLQLDVRPALMRDPRVVALFQRYEAFWRDIAQRNHAPYVSRDQRQIERFASFIQVQDTQSLQQWLRLHDYEGNWNKNPGTLGEMSASGEVSFSTLLPQTYSLTLNSTLVDQALEHYIDLAPKLLAEMEQEWSRSTVWAFRKARAFYASLWELATQYPHFKEREIKTQERIATLQLTPFQKFLAFSPFPDGSSDHLWNSENRWESFPKTKSDFNWLETRDAQPERFQKFHAELVSLSKFVVREYGGYKYKFGKEKKFTYYATGVHQAIRDYERWISESLSLFELTQKDVETVLGDDLYWYSKERDATQKYINLLKNLDHRINSDLDEGYFDWLGNDLERQKKEFDAQIQTRLKSRVKNTFYDRPEYKTDLIYSQKMQLKLYQALKELKRLPTEIHQELELWKRFAIRGVTDFTDEWAERILDQSIHLSSEEKTFVVRSLFRSQLVWDLRVRERLARLYYSVDTNTQIAKTLQERDSSWGRVATLQKLATEVNFFLPESSQEKFNVFNHLANLLQLDRKETTYLRKQLSVNDTLGQSSVGEVTISDDEALGSRVLSQIFVEIRKASLEKRLEMLSFMLGNQDQIPELMKEAKAKWDNAEYNVKKENQIRIAKGKPALTFRERIQMTIEQLNGQQMGLRIAAGVLGPHRTRRLFQSLDPKTRAVLLDPLLLGSRGLVADPKGREWVIRSLVPPNASWKQLAVDLSDGYILALTQLGQSHLKTLFVSYLLASSAKTSYGKYHEILSTDPHVVSSQDGSDEQRQAGQVLKRVFEANAALTKIGQRLHSSHVLHPEINSEIASLKDEATPVGREDYFNWLQDASRCGDICESVRLLDVKGSASVKAVMGAKINGVESVIHLVRPNASRRGENSFELIEYALKYAIKKGHEELRVILPIISRARDAFRKEVDLSRERISIRNMAQVYSPGKIYGQGFQFITPELVTEFDALVKPESVEAVKSVPIRKFSELSREEKLSASYAISQKEAEITLSRSESTDQISFDKDRHEGNYLFITDQALLDRYQVPAGGGLILVIDPGQWSEISVQMRDSILHGVALLGAAFFGLGDPEALIDATRDWIVTDLVSSSVLATDEQAARVRKIVQERLADAQNKGEVKPGEVLSSILSHVEALHLPIHGQIWDFVTAFSTNQSWDHLLKSAGLDTPYTQLAMERVMEKVQCLDLLNKIE